MLALIDIPQRPGTQFEKKQDQAQHDQYQYPGNFIIADYICMHRILWEASRSPLHRLLVKPDR